MKGGKVLWREGDYRIVVAPFSRPDVPLWWFTLEQNLRDAMGNDSWHRCDHVPYAVTQCLVRDFADPGDGVPRVAWQSGRFRCVAHCGEFFYEHLGVDEIGCEQWSPDDASDLSQATLFAALQGFGVDLKEFPCWTMLRDE